MTKHSLSVEASVISTYLVFIVEAQIEQIKIYELRVFILPSTAFCLCWNEDYAQYFYDNILGKHIAYTKNQIPFGVLLQNLFNNSYCIS